MLTAFILFIYSIFIISVFTKGSYLIVSWPMSKPLFYFFLTSDFICFYDPGSDDKSQKVLPMPNKIFNFMKFWYQKTFSIILKMPRQGMTETP